MTIRVLLADDEPLVRAGIAMLVAVDPEIEVIGEVGDGQAAVDAALSARPDVVVMDLRMPRMDGVEATRRLTDAWEQAHEPPLTPIAVLVLTTFNLDEASYYAALRAGASGFLLKDAAPSELRDAIKTLARGGGWLDPAATLLLIKEFADRPVPDSSSFLELRGRFARERDASATPARSDLPSPGNEVSDQVAQAVFRMEGEFWRISYEQEEIHLKDSIGLHYVSCLLRQPGREFHVLDLVRLVRGSPQGLQPTRGGQAGDSGLHLGPGHAGELLDDRAKAAYKRRIVEVEAELQEAEAWADTERASALREELEMLAEELARAVGLGGRDRVAASDAERARVNVTKAIWGVSRRIAKRHPMLGRHFERSLRTGTYCCYSPDEHHPVVWFL
jgi:DNA-binding NarL/FixJ family response regulator